MGFGVSDLGFGDLGRGIAACHKRRTEPHLLESTEAHTKRRRILGCGSGLIFEGWGLGVGVSGARVRAALGARMAKEDRRVPERSKGFTHTHIHTCAHTRMRTQTHTRKRPALGCPPWSEPRDSALPVVFRI